MMLFCQEHPGLLRAVSMAELEPPKEDFSVGPLSVLSESVSKNCQVAYCVGAA